MIKSTDEIELYSLPDFMKTTYMRDCERNIHQLALNAKDEYKKKELLVKIFGYALECDGVPRMERKKLMRKELRRLQVREKLYAEVAKS